jgi:hypothetical protein
VFEEMDLRKEQFWQMEELQNKHSEEECDVSESDKKLSESKGFSHLVFEFNVAKITRCWQLIPEHGRRRFRQIIIILI